MVAKECHIWSAQLRKSRLRICIVAARYNILKTPLALQFSLPKERRKQKKSQCGETLLSFFGVHRCSLNTGVLKTDIRLCCMILMENLNKEDTIR